MILIYDGYDNTDCIVNKQKIWPFDDKFTVTSTQKIGPVTIFTHVSAIFKTQRKTNLIFFAIQDCGHVCEYCY